MFGGCSTYGLRELKWGTAGAGLGRSVTGSATDLTLGASVTTGASSMAGIVVATRALALGAAFVVDGRVGAAVGATVGAIVGAAVGADSISPELSSSSSSLLMLDTDELEVAMRPSSSGLISTVASSGSASSIIVLTAALTDSAGGVLAVHIMLTDG